MTARKGLRGQTGSLDDATFLRGAHEEKAAVKALDSSPDK